MDQSTYDAIPTFIQVREFKVHGVVYVTTLLDAKRHHKKELAKLYESRWQVEINLRSIKAILGMEHLFSKTPDMVKKEIGAHFLGYNVIRTLIVAACRKNSGHPNQISFKGTVQLLNQFSPYFSGADHAHHTSMYNELLRKIVLNRIGNRPGRVEPRAIKRRRKSFVLLKRSRKLEQKNLMKKRRKS